MQEWIRQIIIYVILVTDRTDLAGSQSGATRFTSRYGLA